MNAQHTEENAAKARANPAWRGLETRRQTATSSGPDAHHAPRESTAEGALEAFRIIVGHFDPYRKRIRS